MLNNNLHGAKDFFDAVEGRTLPSDGGVFYLRGGYDNNDGLVPVDPTPAIQHAFLGNDDHPAYSDQQISEAFAAKAINDIANSPYWSQSAIIITYDETDGFYDHVSPESRNTFRRRFAPGGWSAHSDDRDLALRRVGQDLASLQRARLGDQVHQRAEGPGAARRAAGREERALRSARPTLARTNLGPSDDPQNDVGDLTEAFDYDSLAGRKAPIPASAATFTPAQISTLPHLAPPNYSPNGYTNGACAAIGILPTDFQSCDAYKNGDPIDPYPADVNPRPTASPGTPTSGTWTP